MLAAAAAVAEVAQALPAREASDDPLSRPEPSATIKAQESFEVGRRPVACASCRKCSRHPLGVAGAQAVRRLCIATLNVPSPRPGHQLVPSPKSACGHCQCLWCAPPSPWHPQCGPRTWWSLSPRRRRCPHRTRWLVRSAWSCSNPGWWVAGELLKAQATISNPCWQRPWGRPGTFVGAACHAIGPVGWVFLVELQKA